MRGRTGGTGLGLSIVKRGALLHGARVELTSEPERGTTVRILFQPDKSARAGRRVARKTSAGVRIPHAAQPSAKSCGLCRWVFPRIFAVRLFHSERGCHSKKARKVSFFTAHVAEKMTDSKLHTA
jgi:hypothetical protein